jgi:hypothetical protein
MSFTEVHASLAATKTVLITLGEEQVFTDPVDVRGYRFLLPMLYETDNVNSINVGIEAAATSNGPFGVFEELPAGFNIDPGSLFHHSFFLFQPGASTGYFLPLVVPFVRFAAGSLNSVNRSFYLHCSS